MPKEKTNLVIVESPSKAKTIGKYLGPDYEVKASMGHLRDLPKSTLGVDIEHDFEPEYRPLAGKESIIKELRDSAKKCQNVYLATDPDREGEAISWHLKYLLDIPDDKTMRVTFNEITKDVVRRSIAQPRAIDQNLVDAQQARRVLDRIVGYQLSPLLWKKVRKGLSAGRVQSVATRLVVDRENEIRAFVPQEYWSIDARLERVGRPGSFTAHYYGDPKKRELHSAEEVEQVLSELKGQPFGVKSVKKSEKKRNPAPPFITSTLQQEASRKLNMTPRRTMMIAQQLYEGVEITGEGSVGLITYMRTDSLRISEEALEAAGKAITARYGAAYYSGPRRYKPKSGAQDAHEAIRPTNIELSPDVVRKDLTNEQYRLYRLIWGRFTACQMANAVYDNVVVDVDSAGYVFRANYSEMRFAGYTAVYEEGKDEESDEPRSKLPSLEEGEQVFLEKMLPEQQFTQPPARYTEATLIRAMEEKGIGRPSTYAPTISTITSHEYVVKDGKYLKPTNLGEIVTQLMEERFPDIVDLKFTNHMEEELDEVESGKLYWKELLRSFYGDFSTELEEAEKALDGVRIKVPDELSDEYCDVCGRQMVVKSGRFGRFLACPAYPECSFTKPIVIEMPGKCPKCGSRILKRTSKKGNTYYACERGADCPWRGTAADGSEIKGFMTWYVPTKDNCPSCGKTLFKPSGRGRQKAFCINEDCPEFVPEDKRGYKKKAAADSKDEDKKTAEKKPAAKKKTTAKKAKE